MATTDLKTGAAPAFNIERQRRIVEHTVAKQSFALLATSSKEHHSHVAGVLYAAVDRVFYISTDATSIKARNIRQNPRVAVSIPVRKLPIGPPFTIQFQGAAEILAVDDPRIRELHAQGLIKRVTSHGELDLHDGCFIRVTPGKRVSTYGLGVPLLEFLRNPLTALRSIDWS